MAEDPNFNWNLLRLATETKFIVPCTGVVQQIAADLLAGLPTMAARDQHDARFVLAVVLDWQDLDEEMDGKHCIPEIQCIHHSCNIRLANSHLLIFCRTSCADKLHSSSWSGISKKERQCWEPGK